LAPPLSETRTEPRGGLEAALAQPQAPAITLGFYSIAAINMFHRGGREVWGGGGGVEGRVMLPAAFTSFCSW
jgi:hypothetical protein